MVPDNWDEFWEDEDAEDRGKDAWRKRQDRHRESVIKYEVGLLDPPSPEIMTERDRYLSDFVSLHHEVFTESSGLKPLGPAQQDSCKRSQDVMLRRGRVVKCEPRSYGKTTRSANEATFAVLTGRRRFVLIVASSVEKAKDIIDGIKTELQNNQRLARLFPNTCAAFAHAANLRAASVKYQTIGNLLTNIKVGDDRIIFPTVPGEPSSGAVIMVRSRDNVRGTIVKVKSGDEAGRVLRPDLVIMDDIQTEQDADNPETVRKLVKLIKKAILRSGRLGKRIDAIMTITPQNPGDLATHFMENEPGWEVVRYQMLTKRPSQKAEEMWLGEYRELLLNYDKHKRGDKIRAQLEALQYYKDNKEAMDEGAEVSWDWAFGWAEEPQTEISTLQACYNIICEESEDVFETECQCNVRGHTTMQGVMASLKEMRNKISAFEHGIAPESTAHIVCHIDVGGWLLAYTVCASPQILQPNVIDYGTWPQTAGHRYSKTSYPRVNIQTVYADYPTPEERMRMALIDLITHLTSQRYRKPTGLPMSIGLIGVDARWNRDEVFKVCREHHQRAILIPQMGASVRARDVPINDRIQSNAIERHFYCSTLPARDHSGHILYVDVNFFKTQVHKGWMTRTGATGSINMYIPNYTGEHEFFFESQLREVPEKDFYEKEQRTVVVWNTDKASVENEFFDNLTGCLALFSKCNVLFPQQIKSVASAPRDAAEWYKSQMTRKF